MNLENYMVSPNEYKKAAKALENALDMNTKQRLFPNKYLYHPINKLNNTTKSQLLKKLSNSKIPTDITKLIMGAKTSYSGKNSTKNSRKIYYNKTIHTPTLKTKKRFFQHVANKAFKKIKNKFGNPNDNGYLKIVEKYQRQLDVLRKHLFQYEKRVNKVIPIAFKLRVKTIKALDGLKNNTSKNVFMKKMVIVENQISKDKVFKHIKRIYISTKIKYYEEFIKIFFKIEEAINNFEKEYGYKIDIPNFWNVNVNDTITNKTISFNDGVRYYTKYYKDVLFTRFLLSKKFRHAYYDEQGTGDEQKHNKHLNEMFNIFSKGFKKANRNALKKIFNREFMFHIHEFIKRKYGYSLFEE